MFSLSKFHLFSANAPPILTEHLRTHISLPPSPSQIQRLPYSEEEGSESKKEPHSSIAEEEEEGEGGREEEDTADGAQEDGVSGKRDNFKEPGVWTMSLDRRNPLSPQKKRVEVSHSVVSVAENGEGETHFGSDHAPNTDPTPRRMRGGARNEEREETDRPLSSSESSHSRGLVAAGREGVGREEMGVVSSRKPPLPPGVRESRRDHDKQQQQQKEAQPTKSVETVLLSEVKEEMGREEVREGGRSHQLNEDTTRRYLAQMKARGHKRASSAPIPYQPPAPPLPPSSDLPLAPHIEVREATEDNRTTHVKVHTYTVCVVP